MNRTIFSDSSDIYIIARSEIRITPREKCVYKRVSYGSLLSEENVLRDSVVDFHDSSLLPSVCRYMIRSSMRAIPVAMVKSDSTERFRSAVSSKKR
jgi:hypothetical protein